MFSQIQTAVYQKVRLWPEDWASTTAYVLGDVVKASTYNSHSYKCTTAGTSGAGEPTWPTTNGATKADGTVTWTTYDQKTYNVIAPQTSSAPYVTFGLLTEAPIGDFGDFEAIANLTYWVNCFSDKSLSDVCEISDEVMDALDNASISASGYAPMKCVREFIGQPIYDMDTKIYQSNLRYRIWMSKD